MRYFFKVLCLIALSINTCDAYESLLKSNVNCQTDLNNDGKNDIVLFIEKSPRDWDLVALLKTNDGYNAYVLLSTDSPLNLSCQNEKYIQETTTGDREGKLVKTNGAYVKLIQPESSSVGYYWDGKKFQGVQISD